MSANFDRGPLAWVKSEIDVSLERARSALRAFNGETPPRAELATCRAHLHQAAGAVHIVGLEGVSRLFDEAEQVVAAIEAGALEPAPAVLEALEQALSAIETYLGELLDGARDEPLRLYPEYCVLAQARGAPAPAEAELYFPDLSLRPPPRAEPALRLPRGEFEAFLRAQCGRFQRALVQWLREPAAHAPLEELRDSVDQVEKTQVVAAQRAFWWAAGAMFDALAQGTLAGDAGLRQVCTRIEQQLRRMAEGSLSVAERLQREVLYWVARAAPSSPRALEVKQALALPEPRPARPAMADISQRLTVARNLRESVGTAKHAWSKFAAGVASALAAFAQQAQAVAAHARHLDAAALAELAAEIERVARELQREPRVTSEALAMEVMTALLLLEAAAENYRHLGTEFEHNAQEMRARLAVALAGAAATPPPGPLLEEMARRAQEKLALAAAFAEIQAGLQSIERALEECARAPASPARVAELDAMIRRVAGALAMLGEDAARAALEGCARDVRALGAQGASRRVDAVAEVLSGLGQYIEALGRGRADFAAYMRPARADTGGAPETAAPSVELELEQARRAMQAALDAWRARPQDPGLKAELRHRLEAIRDDAMLVADASLCAQASDALAELDTTGAVQAEALARFATAAQASETAQRLKQANAATIDREMLAVFAEEASAVLGEIAQALEHNRAGRGGGADLAVVRRALHTLKGSGRMVGLTQLSETAGTLEQIVDLCAHQGRGQATEVVALVERAHADLGAWLQAVRAQRPPPDLEALVAAARRVARGAPPVWQVLDADGATVAIGGERVPASLFTVFCDEAHDQLEACERALPDCADAAQVPERLLRAAHTLAGICGTLRIDPMQHLAQALEHTLRSDPGAPASERRALFADAVAALKEMYAEVRAQRMPQARDWLVAALAPRGGASAAQAEGGAPPPRALADAELGPQAGVGEAGLPDDAVDAQLLPIFLEEAQELAPHVDELLARWRDETVNPEHAKALQRALHTFKGSARMAGASSLGELAHRLEARVESALGSKQVPAQLFDDLERAWSRAAPLLERLRGVGAAAAAAADPSARADAAARASLRVPAAMLEKLVNQAGEVAIARSRIESELRALRQGLGELTEYSARLREQLRDIEIQADAQLPARLRRDDAGARAFDPLELDRYTRVQELARMTAESVNDVLAVRQNLARALDACETALAAQGRLNREVQQDLMHIRTVPVGTLGKRLRGLVRRVCAELGRSAEFELRGAEVELDRAVLERITGPLEHLLRNAATHGIEPPARRAALGKPPGGTICLEVRQEGNEVALALSDDGAGLDLDKIHARALALGLLEPHEQPGAQRLAELIFEQGLSTATRVTEVAGRGVGMDVVKSEVSGLGGRIELASSTGEGTCFTIRLPLASALGQVVLLKAGRRRCAVPAVMVEHVQHLEGDQLAALRAAGHWDWSGRRYPLAELAALLGEAGTRAQPGRALPLLLLRAGADALALLADEMSGNQEVVVKKLGAQLARIPGLAGATVLGNGELVLIVNPALLARNPTAQPPRAPRATPRARVMVVDDSLTMRKVTGRLLVREGYEVLSAKDGVDALEQLAETVPDVMLLDVEMPRMNGFELARSLRADPRLAEVPIIMITSRTAGKHRRHALQLGVDAFLGKPYQDTELLAQLGRLAAREAPAERTAPAS